ncbi:Decapping nuclease RAI1 [Erysiphe neolycopersici]|uniref:Decapping nuclease n=1 Tax=Erysiphe neolycopersici TaxID=212602 RepID=A0A420HXQ9_9PEZI|nr:Decapping nuclease RAI1 [Erysiphe neolycopersici]
MNYSFSMRPINKFNGPKLSLKFPKEIACFSYDDEHQFRLDDSSIKYYYTPSLGADLCEGFEHFQKLEDTGDEHLESLLKTLINLEQKTGQKVEANFITWRGMMTKLMGAIYDNFDGFEMNATIFQVVSFIEENYTYKLQTKHDQLEIPTPRGRHSQEMMSYWGYKFETLSLLPKPWNETTRDYIETRKNLIVNNKAQYCSVVQTELNGSTMILGGEIDGVWDMKQNDGMPVNWIELKTCAEARNERDLDKLDRKLMKFYIQSYLLGVPKVIVGYRTSDGILVNVEEFKTLMIPSIVMKRKHLWDANICLTFLDSLLKFLRTIMTNELQNVSVDDAPMWRIRRKKQESAIEVFRVEGNARSILSSEFVSWRLELASKQN